MFQKALKDAYCIVRSPLAISRRLQLLAGLVSTIAGSGHLLGWNVKHLRQSDLVLLYSEIFAHQGYRFISRGPNPVILDCGANIGMATLYFKWLYPGAQITAFEPDPSTFAVLKDNISANRLEDVEIHNVALGKEESEIDFHIAEPGSLMMSAVAGRTTGQTIRVACRRLSTFIAGEIDLLKLDIEGMEEPVLDEIAASGKLSLVREMIIEVHHNLPGSPSQLSRMLALLEHNGFHYHVVNSYAPSLSDCSAFQDVIIHAQRQDG
ncbi:MAG TPA: FkbM family methyltransferase [Verrucomicrobiae bacterium]|jgi:FkbM family methyltransferase|nr:FkbM family methyltransferase [Verrucomicrobiae bacterium]